MVSDTELDNSFTGRQFLTDGFQFPFLFDWNKNDDDILRYICKDIPATVTNDHLPRANFWWI